MLRAPVRRPQRAARRRQPLALQQPLVRAVQLHAEARHRRAAAAGHAVHADAAAPLEHRAAAAPTRPGGWRRGRLPRAAVRRPSRTACGRDASLL
eukprot:455220-Prymnesium_polylepis.1